MYNKTFFPEFGISGEAKVLKIMRGKEPKKGRKERTQEEMLKSERKRFPDFSPMLPREGAQSAVVENEPLEKNSCAIAAELILEFFAELRETKFIDDPEYKEVLRKLMNLYNKLVTESQTPDTETPAE